MCDLSTGVGSVIVLIRGASTVTLACTAGGHRFFELAISLLVKKSESADHSHALYEAVADVQLGPEVQSLSSVSAPTPTSHGPLRYHFQTIVPLSRCLFDAVGGGSLHR